MSTEYIKSYIESSISTKAKILEDKAFVELIAAVADEIVEAYKQGKKVLVAGNGGSAADSQHIAGELVSRFYFDRPGLAAIALTVDTSILTAIGNDYGYEYTFSRQVEANGVVGDVFIGLSTSGNSPNIVKAMEEANKKGIITVGFTGDKPCKMDELCKYMIKVPSVDTPKVQESHIMIAHIICALVEKALFEKKD